MRIGVVTVSDRCFRGESEDRSGPAIIALLKQKLDSGATFDHRLVPDEIPQIQAAVKVLCDEVACHLVVTTGGTGFSQRDTTPEAVRPLLTKEAPGIVHAMMNFSLGKTPVAWLSRPVAGVRNTTVVITVPGSAKAAEECLTPLVDHGLKHAITLASGDQLDPHPKEASANRVCVCGQVHDDGKVHDHSAPPLPSGGGAVAERARKSEYPMVSMTAALKQIAEVAAQVSQRRTVLVPAEDALGKVLAEDVTSVFDHPPFRASIKDGYAVVASDGPGTYPVVGSLVAGSHPEGFVLQPGWICRVNTGGPVPPGADAVVQVEDTELVERTAEGEERRVKINKAVKAGTDIRPIGCDLATGGVALKAGCVIRAPEVGLALSVGAEALRVFRAPTVAIVSTGDELVDRSTFADKGGVPPAGKIFDSNRSMLLAACKAEGVASFDGKIASDSMASTRQVITRALDNADIVVTSGGVSMGEVDCVKKVLIELGATIHFGRVNMKPGKPTTFAQLTYNGQQKLVFGLPGNPVSAMVCFHLFVVPALRSFAQLPAELPTIVATTPLKLQLDPERPEYHRCAIMNNGDGTFTAVSTGIQASHRLLSLSGANGLMVLPAASPDKKEIPAGSVVEVVVIGPLPPFVPGQTLQLPEPVSGCGHMC